MQKLYIALFFNIILIFNALAQGGSKSLITHDVYDDWKTLNKSIISNNGVWVAYEVAPFTGDGFMVLYNAKKKTNDTIHRAYDAVFSAMSDFIVFKIKPQENLIREAKLKKTKSADMPKDSIGYMALSSKRFVKFANLKSFKIPEEESSWFAYTVENVKKQTTKKDTEASKNNSNIKTATLHIVNPLREKFYTFNNVSDFNVSKNGKSIVFVTNSKETPNEVEIKIFTAVNEKVTEIFKNTGEVKNVVLDNEGKQLAFIYTADTTKNKNYTLYYFSQNNKNPLKVIDNSHRLLTQKYVVSEHAALNFSDNGTSLYWGYAAQPIMSIDDSLPDDEKVMLDLWSWTDPQIQSQQLAELEKERKKHFLAAYHITNRRNVLLAKEHIPVVRTFNKGNASVALGISDLPYLVEASWAPAYKDFYLIDIETGKARKMLDRKQFNATVSPLGKYFVYYDDADSLWYAYNILKDSLNVLTKNLSGEFYNTEFDRPDSPPPFGIAGWIENDSLMLINDKYHIWLVDPEGRNEAVNLTEKFMKGRPIVNRFVKLNNEDHIKKNNKILIKYVDEVDRHEGFYWLNLTDKKAEPVLYKDNCRFTSITKAKNSNALIFRRSTYIEYPDLWLTDTLFNKPQKVSLANPQQNQYLWGTVELINWDFEGANIKGMLYKPENFDSLKKYPMITYFYERTSHTVHAHYIPAPSRSVINFPLYTSNGYLIFMPDISYEVGYPGESALRAVVSGVEHLISRGYVDKDKLGIHGQSWGGYQTAFIITRTNIFKAAMAGAPVSNMTSAYGAIRRKTGINRIHQYEIGQSRIGGTLWDKHDLYIENSPLFFVDKIQTPLLMMSNDNDGAVPWEQGIELFLAMRRLNKPIWMLNYNNDEHNLTKKPNRKDLSIRMLQFFDYYLKDSPMPEWMKYGISASEKGQTLKYELIE